MADFPRIKWLNIDGRQVPFTEPQHFTGNSDETVRTGHDNPLPVANYTKKGNIWLPVSEDNPMPTQVTGSIVELVRTDYEPVESAARLIFNIDGAFKDLIVNVRTQSEFEVNLIAESRPNGVYHGGIIITKESVNTQGGHGTSFIVPFLNLNTRIIIENTSGMVRNMSVNILGRV